MRTVKDAGNTRARIIDAAGKAFYSRGIRSVGVDDIAKEAGVTKRTLYYYFDSKDQLIVAYLEERSSTVFERLVDLASKSAVPFAQQMEAFFASLSRSATNSEWKGCPFARSVAELAGTPNHSALKVAAKHKQEFERYLRERATASGLTDPDAVAKQLMVLLDGVLTQMLIHRDPAYGKGAARAAASILRDATPNTRR